MSDLEKISCSCGNSYITKSVISSCPSCGKTNYGEKAGILTLVIALVTAITVGYVLGPLIYVWYSKNLKKYHSVLATLSAPIVLLLGTGIFVDSDMDWLIATSAVVNFIAFIFGIFRIFQPR